MGLGEDVRRLRRARDLSLEALAERAGLSTNYVGSIERDRRDPSLSSVRAMAKALGVPLSELLGDRTSPVTPVGLEAARLFDRLPVRVQDSVLGLLRSLAESAPAPARGRRAPPRR